MHSLTLLKILEKNYNIDDNDLFFQNLKSYSLVGSFKVARYAANSFNTEDISLNTKILDNEEKTKILRDILTLVEEINSGLGKIIEQTVRQLENIKENKKGLYRQLSNQTQSIFLNTIKDYIFDEAYKTLNDINGDEIFTEKMKAIKESIGKTIKEKAMVAFKKMCESLGKGAKDFRWQVLAENKLRGNINHILIHGGFKDGSTGKK